MNDSTSDEIMKFEKLPNTVARDIVLDRGQNSTYITWDELQARVASVTPNIVKLLKKAGVKLSKRTFRSNERVPIKGHHESGIFYVFSC